MHGVKERMVLRTMSFEVGTFEAATKMYIELAHNSRFILSSIAAILQIICEHIWISYTSSGLKGSTSYCFNLTQFSIMCFQHEASLNSLLIGDVHR